MVGVWTVVGLAIVGGALLVVWGASVVARNKRHQAAEYSVAKLAFRRRREYLEARFVTLASKTNAVQGFTWGECDFANDVSFARDRSSGELRALVGVTITFEPADEHELSSLGSAGCNGSILAATAVFRYVGDEWLSDGRAIFNLDPGETIRRFGHELEAVE
jgi:hypothetical protein